MKVTVDIPEPLYRRLKARAALEGRTVRDVTIELYERWLATPMVAKVDRKAFGEAWIARWEELGRQIAEQAVDPRTTVEILLADRR